LKSGQTLTFINFKVLVKLFQKLAGFGAEPQGLILKKVIFVKHLFIVNPVAVRVKGRLESVVNSIHAFFQEYPHMRKHVHVTRWERDALCVVRKYASEADELLRVHVLGGTGTLSETVNAVVNLPNVQIAAYPYGNENHFLNYFGIDNVHLFSSIRSQVFSNTTPIDVIKCDNMYGISHGFVGLEAAAARMGQELYENSTFMNQWFANIWSGIKMAFGNWLYGQRYLIYIDGVKLDGYFTSMLIANGPSYAKNMNPAVDAHPNDGFLDVYVMKKFSRIKLLYVMQKYLSGNYKKIPDYISYYRGLKISIASDSMMTLTLDDKAVFKNKIEYEILPYAIDFVCPGGIDVEKLPKIYKNLK